MNETWSWVASNISWVAQCCVPIGVAVYLRWAAGRDRAEDNTSKKFEDLNKKIEGVAQNIEKSMINIEKSIVALEVHASRSQEDLHQIKDVLFSRAKKSPTTVPAATPR
jgi:hypothetical protein